MAVRQISWRSWLKQMASHALDDGYFKLAGYPIADVSKRLRVSDQRVRQLIEADRLDALQILTAKGNIAAVIVTEESLEAFEPRPTGRPLQLAFPE
jgi:hypothetical protein